MATNLGELFYTLRVQDLTKQDIDAINQRLQNLGSNIQINATDLKTAFQNASNNIDLKIGTVSNLKQAVDSAIGTNGLDLKIDQNAFKTAFNAALTQAQGQGLNLSVNTHNLRQLIAQQLQAPFEIQIKVIKDQARQAVQNALNNASNISNADALKYQRLQNGELKAQQAELIKLKQAQLQAKDGAKAHATASVNLGGALGRNITIAGELGAAMTSLYSIHAAKEFLAQVVEIGGELEHQKIALDTIYGDPGKTSTLFSQIKGLARQSPFGVMDLTKNIKQLSAYGVAYNEVYDTAKRLADISAATSVDINRLILAFGKTKNRTFLDGLEAKQFAYANIPIYDALSKKLTELEGKFVSVKDVMKRISKREIGFDMVREILWDMTDEGGKFYNMQEKLAGSVKTSWKLVRDNIELMFGEIAESAVGGGLKGMAEILQGLTREWKTLATVVGGMAVVWGLTRTALMIHNTLLEKNTLASIKNQAASKMQVHHNNLAAQSYRNLTQAEEDEYLVASGLSKMRGFSILSRKQLTMAEVDAMMAAKALTREEILKLVALKKVSTATAEYALITKGMTKADIQATQADIARAASASRLTVVSKQLTASLAGIGNALKGLFLNPFTWIMAAISGLVYLWQRNNEEMEKAKAIGDTLYTKATEGAMNLERTLKDIKAPKGLSNLELTQGIENMENALKDYSPTPLKDINDALYTQEGLLRPIEERYTVLKQKLEELKGAFDAIEEKNINKVIENAINDSNGGWFDDDVNTNAKDYDKALSKRDNAITKFYIKNQEEAVKAVKAALQADEAFRKATEGMTTYAQKFKELIKNYREYADAQKKLDVSQVYTRFGGLNRNINESVHTLEEDMKIVWSRIEKEAEERGVESLANATDRVKKEYAIMIKDWINSLEVSDEVKKKMYSFYSELLNFNFETFNAKEKLTEQLNKNLETDLGAELAKKVKNGLAITPEEQKSVNDSIQKAYRQLFEKADEAERRALNEVLAVKGEDGKNHFSQEKGLELQATVNVRADWQEWQRDLDDKLGNDESIQYWIKGEADTESFIGAVRKGYKLAEATIKELEPLLLKAGIQFDPGELISEEDWQFLNASPFEKEMIKGWNDAIKSIKSAQKASSELGFSLIDPKRGSKTSQKDTVAENLKQQFKDLKDAWNEYKKWEKSVGDTAAAETVANSELFGDMPLDKIPRTVEQYQKAIEDIKAKLQKEGVKDHPQRESLLNEILKTLLDVKKTVVDEQIEKALATVDEEIEKKLEDWNLYEKIRKATGNKDLAYQFTFGLEPGGQTDYVRLVKDNFNSQIDAVRDVLDDKLKGELKGHAFELDFEMINRDNVADLPKELQKAWEEAVKRIEKYRLEQRNFVADLLSEYQNTLQRIEKIDADAEEKIMKVWNDPFLNDAQKTNLEMKIEVKADYEKFQLSNDYLQFFGGVLAMTREEAENVGAAIRQHLDEQLQKGVISAKEYYDEIEKIEQQLAKIRNVRSNGLTFMTEGINGLNNKKAEENDAIRLSLAQRIKEYEDKAAKAREDRDEKSAKIYESQAQNLREQLKIYDKIAQNIVQNQELWNNIAAYASVVSNIINGIGEAFDTLREMSGSLGFDTESDDWLNVGGLIDTLSAVSDGVSKVVQSLMNGDIGGMISGAATALLTPITIWAQIHDRKLQKDVEASERLFNKYQDLIDGIEDRLNYFLGNRRNLEIDITGDRRMLEHYTRRVEQLNNSSSPFISQMANSANAVAQKYQARVDAYEKGGALGYERQLMTEQLAQLQRQKADYEGMKGDHSADIDALNRQIEEQRQAILDFSKEMAEVTYGINLNDWAGQIGDALVDAFSKGEDAAEAFKDTVNNIMRSLVSQMITQDIIAPAFKDIEKYLFGEDGLGGVYGEDFLLDEAEAGMLANMLGDLEGKIDDAKKLYDVVNEMMGGGLDNKDKSEDSLRTGIQSITENTADLLASYVNSIRAYVAQDALKLDLLVNEYVPNLYLVAEGQLQQLVMIAENTRRNMLAAEAMKSILTNVEGILTKVTNGTYKFYVN